MGKTAGDLAILPNLLSLARVLLTPVFVVLTVRGQAWPAFWVFVAAGATDALDGFAARALKQRSDLGLWLDPIGDKVLLTAAFVVLTIPALARPNTLPFWMTAICVGRDAAIALGSMIVVALRGRRTFKPALAGKASTIVQVFMIYLVLFLNATGRTHGALRWLFYLTAGLAAASFAQYLVRGVRLLRRGPAAAA
ncbi:MAG TPA: CDP-alcohol phosphatidyltransferase family protein [Candidatus Aminicenantes bacterium]|nr:CDP-alcohol phosphatidyltransferase family protein [Candidatus Aminicenantes bacterium]